VSFLAALLQQTFLQHAVAASLLAALACGVVGVLVVLRRIAFLAGGIAHGALAGMGAAYLLGWPPLPGAIAAALAMAVLLWRLTTRQRHDEEVLIAAMWSVGMAAGLIMIARSAGENPDLMSYLFGNILMVGRDQLLWMAGLDLLTLGIVAAFYPAIATTVFDEEYARLRGLPVEAIRLLLLLLVALTVVLLIQVVGLILVIALLTLPAAAALSSRSMLAMMWRAALIAGAACLGGLWLAYAQDWPAGASMVLLTAAVYLVASLRRR
jgi:zinc transport system permease protein